jgi:hypothetical protein
LSRTRLIRPGFFKHGELFDAERETGLPLRVAFAGLWTVADREGRFIWKPRDIKPDVLPHDEVDFGQVLDALHDHGFVVRYRIGSKEYGSIPSWREQQPVHKTEQPSKLPSPLDNGAVTVPPRVNAVAITVAVTDTGANYSAALPPERLDLIGLVRSHFYTPDGKCPTDWSEVRERSILTALLTRYSPEDVATAVEGAALLRDYPGKYGDAIDWLRPGDKLTLRVLYNTRSGVRPLMGLAIDAANRAHNLSAERDSTAARQPTRIAALVPKAS